MNIFVIFFMTQIVVTGIILFILKQKLNSILIDLAISQVEHGQVKYDGPQPLIMVTTHKKLSSVARERLLKAITKHLPGVKTPEFRVNGKLLGGMIIQVGNQTVDFSLIDRLRKAR